MGWGGLETHSLVCQGWEHNLPFYFAQDQLPELFQKPLQNSLLTDFC